MKALGIKVGVVYIGVIHILRHLKEELAWTTDKWLWVISYTYITSRSRISLLLHDNDIP